MAGNVQNQDCRRWNRWRIAAWSTAILILLLPLLAMQFTDEVDWDLADFLVFGALLAGVGVAYELAVRETPNTAYRFAVGVALASAFLLVWVNGAVGIIGSEDNNANLVYFGVLAVGIIGAIMARFRPAGMARALVATALAQALVAVIALTTGMQHSPAGSVSQIIILNGFFIAMFLGSAWLFQSAVE
jgi:hypothetical protein